MFAAFLVFAAASASAQPACMLNLPGATLRQSAWGKAWYINADEIEMFGKAYVKYGLPRQLRPGDVEAAAEYMGVVVATDPRALDREVIYLLTNAEECEFQPYQIKPEAESEG